MKQLHGKTKNNAISANGSNGHANQTQQRDNISTNNNNNNNNNNSVVENKFRCKVLPEHFTGAIPFVRVNHIMEFDWFVWIPDNINAGDTFVFFVTNDDLIRAQQLRQQEFASTLTPTEQLNYNTKVVNEICKDIPANTQPTRQQQERILQALHPYVPIISNSVIESRNGVACPIFYQRYGLQVATTGDGTTSDSIVPPGGGNNHHNNNTSSSTLSLLQKCKLECEQVLHRLYYVEFPAAYQEVFVVDRKRLVCMMIGFTFTFIVGFILAIHVQNIREANLNGQCF